MTRFYELRNSNHSQAHKTRLNTFQFLLLCNSVDLRVCMILKFVKPETDSKLAYLKWTLSQLVFLEENPSKFLLERETYVLF